MNELRTLEDVVRFAIKEEQLAIDFYLDLAKQVDDFRTRTILEQMARDEMNHKVILTSNLENKDYKVEQKSLESLLNRMNEVVDKVVKRSKLTDIIKQAIEKEWDTACLYKELAETYKDPDISALLITLAEDELKHKRNLEFELEYYDDKK
jgi:rubrerythrin